MKRLLNTLALFACITSFSAHASDDAGQRFFEFINNPIRFQVTAVLLGVAFHTGISWLQNYVRTPDQPVVTPTHQEQ